MTSEQVSYLIIKLKEKGVAFESGLSDAELKEAEFKFNLSFPEDLKLFLRQALPVSEYFMNWRAGLTTEKEAAKIESKLAWPFEGIVFDIENNMYWEESWGEKPDTLDRQVKIATVFYRTYPKLIPICSHRFIPSTPSQPGNPVFSVYQTDIIYYGYDLASYFANEFHFELPNHLFDIPEQPRTIEFWEKFTRY